MVLFWLGITRQFEQNLFSCFQPGTFGHGGKRAEKQKVNMSLEEQSVNLWPARGCPFLSRYFWGRSQRVEVLVGLACCTTTTLPLECCWLSCKTGKLFFYLTVKQVTNSQFRTDLFLPFEGLGSRASQRTQPPLIYEIT